MKSRSFNILIFLALLLSLFGSAVTVISAQAAGLCYVNDDASGTNTGGSWANAYTSLQSAIADTCTEIWVAAGTYKPDASDRAISFNLESGTSIYGGFAGTETLLSERNYVTNITILSGDLSGNDNATISTSEPTRSENSYHVVYANAVDNSAILDGFTIKGGNANTLLPDQSVIHLRGGGMSNITSNPTLTNITFNSNSAGSGGGMYNDSSNPALTNVTFSGNFASSGGGMYNSSSSPTLTNATFSGNFAGAGGGMYVSSGSPILTNVTFSGNSAGEGGGMYNSSASVPTLTNVTISGNLNGGLYMVTATGVYIKNVIIANNTGYDCIPGKGSLNASYSLIEGTGSYACGLTDGVNGNIIGSDPNLGSLTGSPAYLPLNTGSPAINAGTNTGCPATDQRGAPRPLDGTCDIGSYESYAGLTLYAKPSTTGAGTCLDWANACTLQTAISVASSGNDIWVMQGTHKPHASDRTVSFNLESGVEMYGGFAGTETLLSQRNPAGNTTILSGDLSGNDNATISFNEPTRSENSYHVVYANAVDNSAVLDGFTITGGNANGAVDTPYQNGGGMYNLSSNPTITNITFNGNAAAFDGGGMYNYTSSPTLTHVTFSGNSGVSRGGGMYNEYSSPTLTSVTFSANFSSNNGGGMYNNTSNPTLTNVTFSGNSVNFAGGGMVNETSNPTLTHVTFSDNSSLNYGGGMINGNGSSPTLANVTFSGNSADVGGGIYNGYSDPILTNVTFSGNSADAGFGGGMYNDSGSPTLTNVIIANSTGGDCVNNSSSLNATSSNNLIEATGSNACGLTNGVDGNIIGSDPNLGSLTGSPAYFPLISTSPAINTGDDAVCAAAPVNGLDQRGTVRPFGAHCDIGAVEYVSIPLAGPWVGSVSIGSDKNVVAVGRPHIGGEIASYDGSPSGALSAYVPMLFKDAFGGSYDAALYVQNVSGSSANITIKFYDSSGSLSCTKNDTVSSLASKGYWLPAESCLPAGWVGGALLTSDQNIVATGRPHIGAEVMTYNGFSAGSTSAYLPMLFKDAFGGSYDSAFYVQNVSGSSANLTIKYFDSAGTLNCTKSDTLASFASKGYWLPSATCDSGSIPVGWVGSVVVTSDQNIVSVGRPHIGSQVTTYNAFTAGSTSSFVPMLFKDAFGGSYDAAFYIQNVHAINTANITIKYYNSAGTLNCTKSDTLAPLASKGYWVPSATCDSGSLPVGWVGNVEVTSDQPIIGVGRPHIGTQVTTYNGFSSGSSSSFLSMLFKDAFGGSYDSAFYIQNTEVTQATVTTSFYDSAGTLSCSRTDIIPPKSTVGIWVPSATCEP